MHFASDETSGDFTRSTRKFSITSLKPSNIKPFLILVSNIKPLKTSLQNMKSKRKLRQTEKEKKKL